MRKTWALWAGAALGIGVLLPGAAQAQAPAAPFQDVPQNHWAYDAVNSLAAKGIFTGYPDKTFGGRRALTRYEFALALQRMLAEVDREITSKVGQATRDITRGTPTPGPAGPRGQAGGVGPRGPAGPPGPGVPQGQLQDIQRQQGLLRSDITNLQRLSQEFSSELAMLGANVDQIKRNLQALADRLTKVEAAIAKMPKITGAVNIGFRGTGVTSSGAPQPFEGPPGSGFVGLVDRDGRLLSTGKNVLERVNAFYDIDLGITANISDVATAHLLLNAGNYLKGYLGNRVSQVNPFIDRGVEGQSTGLNGFTNFTTEDVVPYYLYLETPLKIGGVGTQLTVGKFGHQFTPYTLKMVDVDSYFYNDKTDLGDYPITGARANFRAMGVNFSIYGGVHSNDYGALTSTAGRVAPGVYESGFEFVPGLTVPGGNLTGWTGSFFGGTPGLSDPARFRPQGSFGAAFLGLGSTLLEQSAGVRATYVGKKFQVGGTYLTAVGSASDAFGAADLFRRLDVYGIDFNVRPWRQLGISGSVTETRWDGQVDENTQKLFGISDNDRRAWDFRATYPIWKLNLAAFYKRIGDGFDAPGSWGRMGNWINPRGIEGFGGSLSYPISRRLVLDFEGASYRYRDNVRLGAPDSDLTYFRAGLRYPLTSRQSIDLGYERVDFDKTALAGLERLEQYFNLGFTHQFNPNMSVRLLYQFEDVHSQGFLDAPGFRYQAHIIATQFQARF